MVNRFPVSASEAGAVGLSTSEEGAGIPEFQSEVKPTSTESARSGLSFELLIVENGWDTDIPTDEGGVRNIPTSGALGSRFLSLREKFSRRL